MLLLQPNEMRKITEYPFILISKNKWYHVKCWRISNKHTQIFHPPSETVKWFQLESKSTFNIIRKKRCCLRFCLGDSKCCCLFYTWNDFFAHYPVREEKKREMQMANIAQSLIVSAKQCNCSDAKQKRKIRHKKKISKQN